MGKTQYEQELAVKSGYWPLYRYNPELADEGKNPFVLESKDPDGSLQEFLSGENRYGLLERTFPEESKKLRSAIEADYLHRYEQFKALAALDVPKASVAADPKGGAEAGEGCTASDTAEHSRPEGGEACDDGRKGK